MKYYLTALLLIFMLFSNAQSKTDSLLRVTDNLAVHDSEKIKALDRLAFVSADDSVSFFKYNTQILKLSEKINWQKGKGMFLASLAYYYEMQYNFPLSEKYYQQAITFYTGKNLQLQAARTYKNYGLLLKKQRRYDDALAAMDTAAILLKNAGELIELESLYGNIGNLYGRKNDFNKAISFHLKELELAERRGNNQNIATAYSNMSVIYEKNGDFKKALQNQIKALPYSLKSNDEEMVALLYQNLGASYENNLMHDSALYYMRKGVELYKKLNQERSMLIGMTNIGSALNSLHRYIEAFPVNRESIILSNKIKDSISLTYSFVNSAVSFAGVNKTESAKNMITRAMELQKILDDESLSQFVYENASDVYSKAGNYKTAFEYKLIADSLKDEMQSAEKSKQVEALEVQYETSKKDNELTESRVAIAQKQADISRKNVFLALSILSLGLLCIIIILIIRNTKIRNEKIKKENELKLQIAAAESLNKIQQEKFRISRELHDNIGSQLTFINSSLDNMRHQYTDDESLAETQTITLNTIKDLRNTVWLISNDTITFESFAIKLREYFRPLNKQKEFVEINTAADENKMFDPSIATHVFRIIQEAVNNAVKYANCSLINIDANVIDGIFNLKITDNGKGFLIDSVEKGSGLTNMQERAFAANGNLNMTSEKGKGTSVIFSCKI